MPGNRSAAAPAEGWQSHRSCTGPGCDGSCGRSHPLAPPPPFPDEED
jgi:hypothetical protein